MSNKIANGSTRYTAVFAHVTLVSFGLCCVGQLISTHGVNFQKNTVKEAFKMILGSLK